MEIRQLECLVACAQTKSFKKAASNLYTSQSNVSKIIASLEKELGKKIFERKQYGIELTSKGRQVYKQALSILESTARIRDDIEDDDGEELRVVFQPSSWFATAFCQYYMQYADDTQRFYMTSAPLEDIIRRISNNQDQLGFAYIEDTQFERLQDMMTGNHIGFYVLKKAKTVLYYSGNIDPTMRADLPLIQGIEDSYSGLSLWKERMVNQEIRQKLRVVITTNSDYIMQEILKKTKLSNISPEYLSHSDFAFRNKTSRLEGTDQSIQFICMFRNDCAMEPLARKFFSYIKQYIEEE